MTYDQPIAIEAYNESGSQEVNEKRKRNREACAKFRAEPEPSGWNEYHDDYLRHNAGLSQIWSSERVSWMIAG